MSMTNVTAGQTVLVCMWHGWQNKAVVYGEQTRSATNMSALRRQTVCTRTVHNMARCYVLRVAPTLEAIIQITTT